jgi:hypothetical protein
MAEAFPPGLRMGLPLQQGQPTLLRLPRARRRFEGYDWVRIFEFKGRAVTDGSRHQAMGRHRVLDATTMTPWRFRAEPGTSRSA